MRKLMSGRWLLTIAVAVVFVYESLAGTMPDEDVKLIVAMVVTFYFSQKRDEDGQGGIQQRLLELELKVDMLIDVVTALDLSMSLQNRADAIATVSVTEELTGPDHEARSLEDCDGSGI